MSAKRLTSPMQRMNLIAERRSAAETFMANERAPPPSVDEDAERFEHGENTQDHERSGGDVTNQSRFDAIGNPAAHPFAEQAGERAFGDHRRDRSEPHENRSLP